MNTRVLSTAGLLVGLAVLGVLLAGIGAAIGVTDTITDNSEAARVTVNDDNVTVNGTGERTTLVDDLSNVSAIQIEETSEDEFTVRTVENELLSHDDREHATQIATTNETVRQYLRSTDDPDVEVSPVERVEVGSTGSSLNVTAVDDASGDDENIDLEFVESADATDSVTVSRETSSVEKQATVRISSEDSDRAEFTIVVDLEDAEIVRFIDWQ